MEKEVKLRFTIDTSEPNAKLTITGDAVQELTQGLQISDSAARELTEGLTGGLNGVTAAAQEAKEMTEKVGAGGSTGIQRFKTQAGATQATLMSLNYTLRDAPFLFQNFNMGIMAISNNIGPLLDGLQDMKAKTGSLKGTFGTLVNALRGPAGLTVALTLVVGAIQALSSWMSKARRETKELGDEAEETGRKIQKSLTLDLESRLEKNNNLIAKMLYNTGKIGDSWRAQVTHYLTALKTQQELAGVYDSYLKKRENGQKLTKAEIAASVFMRRLERERTAIYKELDDSEVKRLKQLEAEQELVFTEIKNRGILARLDEQIKALQKDKLKIRYEGDAEATKSEISNINKRIEALKKARAELDPKAVPKSESDILAQQKLTNELRLELIKDSQKKELAELDVWYNEKKKLAAGNTNALLVLEAVRAKRTQEINERAFKAQDELDFKYAKRTHEILDAQLRAEQASQSVILQEKQAFLKEKLAYYSDDAEARKAIEHEIELNEIAINKALLREYKDTTAKKDQIQALYLQNSIKIARLRGATEIEVAEAVLAARQDNLAKVQAAEYKTAEDRALAVESATGKVLEAEKGLADAQIAERQRVQDAALQFGRQMWDGLSGLAQQYAEQQRRHDAEAIDREMDKRQATLDAERDKRLATAFTVSQRARVNKELDAKEKALEEEAEARKKKAAKKAFEVEQNVSYVNTVINTAESIMQGYAQLGPVGGSVAAVFLGGIGAAQLALIESQEPPGLAGGGLFIGKGGPTEDANLARLSNKEFIINNEMTEKHFSLVDDTNSDRVYYGGDGIIQELRAIRRENKEMRKELNRVSRRPVQASVGLAKYETGAIVQEGEYRVQSGRL